MKKNTHTKAFFVWLAYGLMLAQPAFAVGLSGNNLVMQSQEDEMTMPPDAAISPPDKVILQHYLRTNFRPRCPSSIVKKTNGCMPTGIVRKYNIGQPLPGSVNFAELPDAVQKQLHPAHGYRYVRVGKDVLLMVETTKKVVDTVTLISALQ